MKILFVGKKECPYSLEAFEYLQKLGHEITVVWSAKRNQKFSEEIFRSGHFRKIMKNNYC